MHADIKGALANINKSWKSFEHNGQSMTKNQVIAILKYGLLQGYKTTADFKDGEIDNLLNTKR